MGPRPGKSSTSTVLHEIARQRNAAQIIGWHQQMREFWYPYFFFERTFANQHLQNLPEFTYRPSFERFAPPAVWPMLGWCLLLCAGWYGCAVAPSAISEHVDAFEAESFRQKQKIQFQLLDGID